MKLIDAMETVHALAEECVRRRELITGGGGVSAPEREAIDTFGDFIANNHEEIEEG